ncbi:MAG TPA: PBP1A family penicillin-binding protein [Polyangiales bacterium]|jgi:penicillin-binding protein 1A|nr:PBP1A family penicillin-binding protein [Polyangiales bacterium]
MSFQTFRRDLRQWLQTFDAAESFERFRDSARGRKVIQVGIALAILGALGIATFIGGYFYFARGLPTIAVLQDYRPPQVSRIVDRKQRLIAESYSERRTVVPMERVPRVFVLSVLAAEDADFYRHGGLDYTGVLRALYKDLMGMRREGGSTITQQLVKTMLLTPERTYARKLRELILARRIESELSKDEILHLYINHINFGHGHYGVEEASQLYFDKHVQDLTLGEASMIAGIAQSPTRNTPISHPEAARKRQLYVLSQLEAKRAQYWDDLPLEDIKRAREEPVTLHVHDGSVHNAPEVATLSKAALRDIVGDEALKLGGYTLTSSIDLDYEEIARKALRKGLQELDARQGLQAPLKAPKKKVKLPPVASLSAGRTYDALVTGVKLDTQELLLDVSGHAGRASIAELARWNPKQLPAAEFAEPGAQVRVTVVRPDSAEDAAQVRPMLGPQGAVVMIDPRTREVLALIGGDEAIYGFNRATQAVRQPGSTWKPVEFALALENKVFTPASLVLDAPEVYDEWKPNNYETWRYTGPVRLREALAQSINLVAVRVVAELTPRAVVDFAKKLGIQSPLDPSLALALGASGVKPIELVNAYATFAAGGRYQPPRFVRQIQAPDGTAVVLPEDAAPVQVMTPAGAYLITSMMMSVVQEGTGKAAQVLARPVAGKTGTSNRVRDAWFVGFTPELVAGVWVGFDDLRPLGKKESGAHAALPIWIDIMKAALAGRPAVEFPMPAGLVSARIDPKSGKLAYDNQPDAIDELFLEGTEPTEVATPPDVLDSGSFMMEQLGSDSARAP